MEVASRQTARLLQSSNALSNRLLLHQTLRTAASTPTTGSSTATTLNRNRRRYISTTTRKHSPESSSLFSLGSGSAPSAAAGGAGGGGGGVPSYFSHRSSLPANTVIRFVPQQTAWIVERMGKFDRILEPGLAILVPFLDRIAYVKSLKESAIEIPSQNAITADNVTLELDGVLYTRVFDAYKAR